MSKMKKVTLTPGQLDSKIKQAYLEGTNAGMLLAITAARDVLKFNEDKLVKIFETVTRYDENVREGLVELEVTKQSIEKHTGVKII